MRMCVIAVEYVLPRNASLSVSFALYFNACPYVHIIFAVGRIVE